ncbi:MAG: SDR family NAD(P)-dependent oxidoreductase [Pseudolabrys sp.]
MRLKGKVALVAGAARNIGKAIALTYAREGADLILVARNTGDELKQVAKDCETFGVKTISMLADVGNPDDVNRVVSQGLDHFGKVNVLACVAALRPHKPFWEISIEEWHQVFAVNLHSTFYLAKALAPMFMEKIARRQHRRARGPGVDDRAAVARPRRCVKNRPLRPGQIAGA